MAKRGFFITLEGPEGSGKSSQCRLLAQALKDSGRKVATACDPGSTDLGQALRQLLLHSRRRISPMAEAMLFFAARVQLVQEYVRPALAKGKIIIVDRYHDSTVAYQGFGAGVDVECLERLGRSAVEGVMPDLTILLDLPVNEGFLRLKRSKDRMEKKARALHERVRRGYRALARRDPKRIVMVPASGTQEAIAKRIFAVVSERLLSKA